MVDYVDFVKKKKQIIIIFHQPMVDYVDKKELDWKDLQMSDAVIRDLIERLAWNHHLRSFDLTNFKSVHFFSKSKCAHFLMKPKCAHFLSKFKCVNLLIKFKCAHFF